MTEQEYVKRLPFLAEFPAELRAQFTAAMNELDGSVTLLSADMTLSGVVGLVMLDTDNPGALLISRALCLVQAAKDTLTPHMMAELQKPAREGKMHVLVIAGDRRVLFEMPVKTQCFPLPSGGN